MSKLIALVFDDPYKADEARAALLRMEGEGLCEIDESAAISKKEGEKIRVSQDVNMVADRQQTGQTLGILAATLTGTLPLIGVGKLIGKLVGRFTDNGVTNSFIDKVKKELGPNTSALLLYITSAKEGGRSSKICGNGVRRFSTPTCPKSLSRKSTMLCKAKKRKIFDLSVCSHDLEG